MFFLSTENPPHDHHPLPSSFLHLTSSSSHELAQSHPQSFSIRDYAYSNRKKNKTKNNWPFSPKSLKLVSTHGVTDPLPPFDEITLGKQIVSHVQRGRDLAKLGLTHQTIAKTRKGVCSQTRTVENGLFTSTSVSKSTKEEIVLVAATTGNKHSKTCGRGGGGGMVKSKEAASCDVGLESIIMASSKTCPICKTFSSASNTTLNAHIDQCISVDSSPVISKPNKTRGKPRMKVKTMVDIYASAKRCTLEDLDKRNGTNWAVISSYSDKSDVSKKRKVPPVGVGPVYVDAKGQKLRILTEFSEKKTSPATLMREQRDEDGSKENSKGSRKRRLGKKHHKYIKLNSHKTNESEVPECQRGLSGEGSSSTGHRRIFNQGMLAKRGSGSKKLNKKGDKVNALQDQPSEDDDDDDDDSWSGGDHVLLRGNDLSALKKQKLQSEVSGRSKTMSGSKRSQRVRKSEKEEKSLAGGAHINTVRLKRSLTSIQEDKYPPRKNVREVTDASPKLLPPFVTNGWRRLSLPVELKKARLDLSEEEKEEEEEEGAGKWESEMTLSDDDYVSDDNEERNEVLHRSNPSTFSGYNDYEEDDDEESSEEEEEANVLDKTDETGAELYQSNATIPSERAMYYSQEAENMVYEEEEVRFDSEVGKGSLYVEVDNIPIPGPPGSFIPSPRGMSYDEHLGNSSVITSQLQSSMDQLDRNSSESPVSAFSNFAAGRLSFPPELSSSLLSVDVPSPYSTTPVSFSVPSHPEKTTTPSSFRNNDFQSCCCQRKERISEGVVTLNHQPSQLLQRRASASSSMAMNLTKPPTRLDPSHPLEQSPYMIQQEFDLHSKFSNKANVNGAVVPPSPSNSVLRLMGKDLMVVMNQGEADNEEASRASLTPTPQFLDPPPPCAGTGLYLNTGLYLRNILEPTTHQPQTPASASAFSIQKQF